MGRVILSTTAIQSTHALSHKNSHYPAHLHVARLPLDWNNTWSTSDAANENSKTFLTMPWTQGHITYGSATLIASTPCLLDYDQINTSAAMLNPGNLVEYNDHQQVS